MNCTWQECHHFPVVQNTKRFLAKLTAVANEWSINLLMSNYSWLRPEVNHIAWRFCFCFLLDDLLEESITKDDEVSSKNEVFLKISEAAKEIEGKTAHHA